MANVKKTIEVNAPQNIVYDQWTQFESFPSFMDGIKSVEQLTDTEVRFHGEIAGKKESWTAKITEQVPDQKVAWQSIEGAKNDGTVTFEPNGPDKTRVTLRLEYEPEDFAEKVGDALGVFEHRVKGDLKNFKKFIEEDLAPEGGWRGAVHTDMRTR